MVGLPPLKEKMHIQQFLSCSNWLRSYLPAEYGHVAKVLGAYQKPGSTFPERERRDVMSIRCDVNEEVKSEAGDSKGVVRK